MTREETIKTIKNYLGQYPIVKIGIFGSYARGEEKEDSDIDMNKSTVNHTTSPPK
jgi:predicted nucleotidyltransferase